MTVQESATSIRLSWSPSSDATGYIISYTGISSGNVTVSGGFISEQLLIGLQNGVTYTISMVATSNQLPSARVVAMDVHLGTLGPSIIILVNNYYDGFCIGPGQPNVGVDVITDTSISFSWSVPNGSVVTSYEVAWQRDTSGECPDMDEDSDTISASVTYDNYTGLVEGSSGNTSYDNYYSILGLEEGSSYTITVTASNAVGSRELTVTSMTWEAGERGMMRSGTLSDCLLPPVPSAPPSSVRVSSKYSSSLAVKWEMVPCLHRNGAIIAYSVRHTGNGSTQTMSIKGDVMEATITGLIPFTEYAIEVAAVTSVGTGVYSIPVFVAVHLSENVVLL